MAVIAPAKSSMKKSVTCGAIASRPSARVIRKTPTPIALTSPVENTKSTTMTKANENVTLQKLSSSAISLRVSGMYWR